MTVLGTDPSTMVGRVYTLRGQHWRVVARWGTPADEGSACCTRCGRIAFPLHRGCKGWWCGCQADPLTEETKRPVMRQGPRNVLLERVEKGEWHDVHLPGHMLPLYTQYRGTGERMVRPFRGLRRVIIGTQGEPRA